MSIEKNVIDVIVDHEMASVKGMKKAHLIQLVRELFEERALEMSNEAIFDYYKAIMRGAV